MAFGSAIPSASRSLPPPHSTLKPQVFPREHISRDEVLVFETKPNLIPFIIQPIIGLIVLLALFSPVLIFSSYYRDATCFLLVLIFVIVLPVLQIVFSYMDWLGRKYALTSDKIMAVSGIISRHLYQCTYDKVQNITLHQGILGRIVGYGTVAFWTAGFGGGTTSMGYQTQVIGGGGVIWLRVDDPVNLKKYVDEVVTTFQREKKMQDYRAMAAAMAESQRAGAPLPVAAAGGPSKFCPSCGANASASAVFCEKCGKKFGT